MLPEKKKKAVIESLRLDGSVKRAADRSGLPRRRVAYYAKSDPDCKEARESGQVRAERLVREDRDRKLRELEAALVREKQALDRHMKKIRRELPSMTYIEVQAWKIRAEVLLDKLKKAFMKFGEAQSKSRSEDP